MAQKVFETDTAVASEGPRAQQPRQSDPSGEQVRDEGPKDQTVGGVIRYFRERLGMSQRDLSKATGHASPEWTTMIETGARKLDIDLAPKVAQILKINPKDLAQLAFSQYYPQAYRALFGSQKPGLPEEKETPVTLMAETCELAMIFDALPPNDRSIVMMVAQALKRNNRSTMHVTRKK